MRRYRPAEDFIRVRDFLKETFYAFGEPLNWGIERWNWARFHPSVFREGDPAGTARNIEFFEGSIRIWEDGNGEIAGVVNVESPEPDGEFFVQRRPGYDALLDEMLDYAETLPKPAGAARSIYAYDRDDALLAALGGRGFVANPERSSCWADLAIGTAPSASLPEGFGLASMAEDMDPAERCKVQGLGFGHADPREWMSVAEYAEVRKAPDYRPELDLATVSPGGEYASCCIVWLDDRNRAAFLEPVCTRPEYRRMGLGRAVVMEGLRRASGLGAERAFVGSKQDFYRRIGFSMSLRSRAWEKA